MTREVKADTALVADIGGTNARFALIEPSEGRVHAVQSVRCADYPTLEAAAEAYLDTLPQRPRGRR
ncbi:glucokinase [Alkalilimnicola ehrlichii]|uniref:glucokinase n=1 Tax=Alkalilimnicola ehrlichii TaxID=351052 RepID=UPI001C6EB043|nr:glucokinase [Alkalilimnicola ehrlichii]